MASSNKISDHSTGYQANNDINQTIHINNGMDANKMFIDVLRPHLDNACSEIAHSFVVETKSTIGETINNFIQTKLIKDLEQEYTANNLRSHISNVKSKSENSEPFGKQSRNPEKLKLIGEWCQEVEKIPESEKLLSDIWEGWMAEMAKSDDVETLKLFLEKMKQMSATDAHTLSIIKERLIIPSSYFTSKNRFYYNRLFDLGLITRHPAFIIVDIVTCLSILILALILCFYFSNQIEIIFFSSNLISFSIIIPLAALFVVLIYNSWFSLRYIRLTWIGKGIMSFAPSPRKDNNDKPSQPKS